MRRMTNDLRAGAGDPVNGRIVFRKHCATCHKLHGEGGEVGPDLKAANRKDRDFLLVSLVDPGAVVRREFVTYALATTSGQVLSGLIVEQDAAAVTLLDEKGVRHRIARSEIEQVKELTTSLMPERLLEGLSPDQLRDLFAYLQSDP
jgi:putative heme-binding domain-containing protein